MTELYYMREVTHYSFTPTTKWWVCKGTVYLFTGASHKEEE